MDWSNPDTVATLVATIITSIILALGGREGIVRIIRAWRAARGKPRGNENANEQQLWTRLDKAQEAERAAHRQAIELVQQIQPLLAALPRMVEANGEATAELQALLESLGRKIDKLTAIIVRQSRRADRNEGSDTEDFDPPRRRRG